MGRPRWTGSTGGKTERGGKKRGGRAKDAAYAKLRPRAPAGATLSPAADKPSIVAPEREKKNARQRNSRSRSARASERASEPFHAPTGRPSKGSSSFFFARLFVFSFSIGMSTAQTRGTPATYVRRGVVAEGGWGVGVVGQKGGVRRIIGLLAQHFSRWHFHSAGRTCSRLLW